MRMLPQELLVLRLRGKKIRRGLQAHRAMEELYALSEDECFAQPRDLTGEDFGRDLDLWERCIRKMAEDLETEAEEGSPSS